MSEDAKKVVVDHTSPTRLHGQQGYRSHADFIVELM